MKARFARFAAATLLCGALRAAEAPAVSVVTAAPPSTAQSGAAADRDESARRAEKRYQEMLDRMQAAVEEVAQLYGNPVFLQVFTNDPGRASELKLRLRAAQSTEDIKGEFLGLEKRREELLSDIALKEREAARLSAKLARQRTALDALAASLELARRAAEDTAK